MSFFLISHLSSIFFPSISEFFLLKSFCLFINDDDTGIGKSVQFMMLLMMKKANGKQVATFITIFHVRHLCFKSPVCVCLRFYNTFYICLTIYSHFTYIYIYTWILMSHCIRRRRTSLKKCWFCWTMYNLWWHGRFIDAHTHQMILSSGQESHVEYNNVVNYVVVNIKMRAVCCFEQQTILNVFWFCCYFRANTGGVFCVVHGKNSKSNYK